MIDRSALMDVYTRILKGELTVADGAHRLGITERRLTGLVADLALGREPMPGEPFARRLRRAVSERVAALRAWLSSAPGAADLRLRLARATATFAIASVGVVMLSGAASVFPAGTRAGEAPDFVRERFASNISFANDETVRRQIDRAGSVYARVDAVLARRGGDGNATLRRALEERRRALEGVKLDYIRHGKNVPVNAALRYRAGEIYDRLVEAYPAPELKSATGLAAELLDRAQTADAKLAAVREFYVASLRRSDPPAAAPQAKTQAPAVAAAAPAIQSPAPAAALAAEPTAAPAASAVAEPPATRAGRSPGGDLAADAKEPWSEEAFRARIAERLAAVKARHEALAAARPNFKRDSRLPVITRFHRRTQIEKALQQATLPPVGLPDTVAL